MSSLEELIFVPPTVSRKQGTTIEIFIFFQHGEETTFIIILFSFFKIYLFLGRGEGREKEKGRIINVWLPLMHPHLGTWPATQACSLTRNQTSDPLVHRQALNPLSHTSQGYIVFYLYCVLSFRVM